MLKRQNYNTCCVILRSHFGLFGNFWCISFASFNRMYFMLDIATYKYFLLNLTTLKMFWKIISKVSIDWKGRPVPYQVSNFVMTFKRQARADSVRGFSESYHSLFWKMCILAKCLIWLCKYSLDEWIRFLLILTVNQKLIEHKLWLTFSRMSDLRATFKSSFIL